MLEEALRRELEAELRELIATFTPMFRQGEIGWEPVEPWYDPAIPFPLLD